MNINLFQNDASALPFATGEIIFQAGEPSQGQMFAVGEGEIDIQLNGQTVETVGPGAFSERWD